MSQTQRVEKGASTEARCPTCNRKRADHTQVGNATQLMDFDEYYISHPATILICPTAVWRPAVVGQDGQETSVP